jgi:hypothetical protein
VLAGASADQQEPVVAGIDGRVDAFRDHRRAAGEGGCDELGGRDTTALAPIAA